VRSGIGDGAKVGSRAERVSHHFHHPACGHTFESRVLIFPLGCTAGDIDCYSTPENADVLDRVRPATITHSPTTFPGDQPLRFPCQDRVITDVCVYIIVDCISPRSRCQRTDSTHYWSSSPASAILYPGCRVQRLQIYNKDGLQGFWPWTE
jgi:hypothetical protein